jgi:chromate transporter
MRNWWKRRWISEQRFLPQLLHAAAGPEATQLAIYIGWLLHRARGGIVAGLLFLLPSLLLLIVLSWLYMAYGHVAAIAAVLYGIKPAVVAIVVAAAWRLGRRTLRSAGLIAIAAAAFVAIAALRLPFPLIVLGAAVLGMAGGRWLPRHFHAAGAPHGAAARWPGPDRRRHAHAGPRASAGRACWARPPRAWPWPCSPGWPWRWQAGQTSHWRRWACSSARRPC